MTNLVIDIEAVRDEAVPFEPRKPDDFPPAACWRIVTIGAMVLDGDHFGVVKGTAEEDRVRTFVKFLESKRGTLITWNGRSFDVPVIVSRAFRYGLSMPWWFTDRNTRYRYSRDGHWDVKDFLGDFGAGRFGSLDQAAKLVGFPGKVGVDGSMVEQMVHDGRQAEVDAYCLCDVAQTAAVAIRAGLLVGELSLESYRVEATRLLERIDAHPSTKVLIEKIDRPAFLLSVSVPGSEVAA